MLDRQGRTLPSLSKPRQRFVLLEVFMQNKLRSCCDTKLWLQPDPATNAYAELNESRRMRSNELHYIDHPLIGVLINIEPIDADPTLERSWQDLQEAKSLTSLE